MTRNEHIDRLVDETLSSLDGIQPAEPAPFLHTRLMARMEGGQRSATYRFVAILSRPVVAITVAVVFLLLNGFILVNLLKGHQSVPSEENGPSLAYEYTHAGSNNSFYANNPENP
jgi:hypothetical protein